MAPEVAGVATTGVGAAIGAVATGVTGAVAFGCSTAFTGSEIFCGAATPDSDITASSAPTATVESTCTTIFCNTPETGEGISVSTLSVDTSSNGSSIAI